MKIRNSLLILLTLVLIGCSKPGEDGFEVTITNVDDQVTLLPGVYFLHTSLYMDYRGAPATEGLKILAETGETKALGDELKKNNEEIFEVLYIDETLEPGEKYTFNVDTAKNPEGVYLTGFHKIKDTTDGYTFLPGLGFYGSDNETPIDSQAYYYNYDAGVKENSPLDNPADTEPPALVVEHLTVNSSILQIQILPE